MLPGTVSNQTFDAIQEVCILQKDEITVLAVNSDTLIPHILSKERVKDDSGVCLFLSGFKGTDHFL